MEKSKITLSKKQNALKEMIQSDFFNIGLVILYMNKYKHDNHVLRILIDRLKHYSEEEIKTYIIELSFYAMFRPFIDLGTNYFKFIFLIITS